MQKLKGYLKKEQGEIVGVASTEAADRHGEIIKQDGWDLNNYKQNPVIMASHNYNEFPIGKATDIEVKDGKLIFKATFSKASKIAKEAAELVKEGILNCFSVGFVPKEYDKKDERIITKSELLEISLVSIPANPEAVVIAKSMEHNDLVQDLIKHWLLDEDLNSKVKTLSDEQDKGESKELEKESDGRDLDLKLLQKTTGHLQELCRQAKKGGADK